MKKITIFLIGLLLVSTSFAKCIDECTSAYSKAEQNALSDYKSACTSAVWNTLKNVGTTWSARFTAGYGGAATAFSMIGFADPYWSVIAAEEQYNQSLGNALNAFNGCMANCS